jgi:uncharacterized protein YfdQ (DUF2303 family)
MPYEDKDGLPRVASDLEVAFEHAERLTEPLTPPEGLTGQPVILVPRGWQQQKVDWTREVPERIRANVTFPDLASFVSYVTDFGTEATRVFAAQGKASLIVWAILDYHQPPVQAGARLHRAVFEPVPSVEWERWQSVNGRQMTQTDFALFLENNADDVAEPDGATLLQVINEFEVQGNLVFQRVQRLASGSVKFSFQNEQQARAGELEVPETFMLELPLWEGIPAGLQRARLRYRLSQAGELKLWFELVNPHRTVREAAAALLNQVKLGLKRPVLLGNLQET